MRQMVAILGTLLILSASALAQTSAGEKAATLRQQIAENESKEAELKGRLDELNEAIKPENIERSLAGVGSTKPEDLRENKRKQLEAEQKGVQAQLDLLVSSRTRMETSLARADADAYRESASVTPSGNLTPAAAAAVTPTAPATPTAKATTTTATRRPSRVRRPRRARHE